MVFATLNRGGQFEGGVVLTTCTTDKTHIPALLGWLAQISRRTVHYSCFRVKGVTPAACTIFELIVDGTVARAGLVG
jgi:hypothetical protein